MLALTVQQPFAWAIVYGGKNIENRTGLARWHRAAGQRIAIHAGLAWHESGAAHPEILRTTGAWDVARRGDQRFTFGAIIGTVLVLDVHPAEDCCDPWGDEQRGDTMSRDAVVHLDLTAPRACQPIPARGALGLWRVPADVELELREAAGR